MSRLRYLGYGHFVTNDGLVDNSLQTQLNGHFASARPIVEEPLVAPEMFPPDKPVNNDGPLVRPKMIWDKPKPNYSDQGTPSQNQHEEPLVAPVMTWD